MPDDAFLVQLEQRTEQVKITLANLEAERARIENMIAQIQPVVPHYDALVAAERALRDANVVLDAPGAARGGASEAAGEALPQHPQEAETQQGGEYNAEAAEQAGAGRGIPPEYAGDQPPSQPWNS